MPVPDSFGTLPPKIVVAPPGPKSAEIAAILSKYESTAGSAMILGKVPVAWETAKGANILDVDDNVYVDFTSGFFVANAGHTNPEIVDAIKKQADHLVHTQGASSPHILRAQLTKRLVELNSPGKLTRAHIASTGAEAIEIASKFAKAYTGVFEILAFHGGFHGKTQGALSLTSARHLREVFLPLLPGVIHAPYAYCYRCPFGREYPNCGMQCLSYIEYLLNSPATGVDRLAAIIAEPVQGYGGIITPPDEFIAGLSRICSERGIMFIVDEIITGFGRTGKLFGYQHSGAQPDLLVLGKGMASGFPVSAVLASEEIMRSPRIMPSPTEFLPRVTSTFMGSPLGCAAALASINFITREKLPEKAAKLGAHLNKRLLELKEERKIIGDVRCKGLMAGIELVEDQKTKKPASKRTIAAVQEAVKRGVIVNPGGTFENVLRLSPPLVITEEQLDRGIDILAESIKTVERS
ncbi:MAG: aspartate aminotransferase family protein [Candidatus Bathyarchaeia archaeon]|jgi:4-aminobutyrate aminotransferase